MKPGIHETMITLSEHQRVLDIMATHTHHACRRRKHKFLLRGFIFCNLCGYRYTTEMHSRKKKAYYHCRSQGIHSNMGQNVAVAELEAQVAEYFKTIQLSQKFIDRGQVRLENLVAEQRANVLDKRRALWNKQKSIEAARDRIEQKLITGVLDDETYCRLKTPIQIELSQIAVRLRQLDEDHDNNIDVIRSVLGLWRDVPSAYQKARAALKRHYLGIFWERFLVQDRRIVEAIPTKLVQNLQRLQSVVINHGTLCSVQESNLRPFA